MISAPCFSSPSQLEVLGRLLRAQQRHAAAGDDAFFQRGRGGGPSVVEQRLALLQFRLGRGADLDLRHAAGQLGQPLLQLLAVVVAVGAVDFAANLLDAAFDRFLVAAAADNRRLVVVDDDLLGLAQVGQLHRVELDAEVLEDRRRAGEDGDVAKHRLAAIAVARGLHGAHVQDAAKLVHHQRRERFAFNILGDDQQRLARFRNRLEQRHEVLGVRDFFFVDQDERIFELGRLIVLVR